MDHNLISRFISITATAHHSQHIGPVVYDLITANFRQRDPTLRGERGYYYACEYEKTEAQQDREKLRCLRWRDSAIGS
jgi:hypothetical protein